IVLTGPSTFKREVDNATEFILLWVKVVVQLHPAWVRWWAVPDASSLVDKVSGTIPFIWRW
ncbi:MAG TPA: hypothetical protein DDW43_08030, partial [Nitrosomonas sp.]|uniref:hypothetical protein n=1 Tax=Nitrosomonas sp. TaxID=42353 RepID=UPI000E8494B0